MKSLVLTLQHGRPPQTGSQARSWHSMQMLKRAGELHVVSLAEDADGGLCDESVWSTEFSLATEEVTTESKTNPKNKLEAFLHATSVLTNPNRKHWLPWLSYVNHFAHLPRKSQTRKASYLKELLKLQHQFLSRYFEFPPIMCTGPLETWTRIQKSVIPKLEKYQYDIFWIENTVCWPAAEQLLKSMKKRPERLILNGQNIEYRIFEQQLRRATPDNRAYLSTELLQMRRMEKKAFRTCDIVIQCSEKDAEDAKSLAPSTHTIVFPNGIDSRTTEPLPFALQNPAPTVLFPASFQYAPNVEAAVYFLREVWPLVVKSVQSARFVLAGREAATLKTMTDNLKNVDIASDVPSMKDYFAKSWLVVVPLLSGGGTRLKILEALAHARPVVSTTLGAEGVPYIDGKHLILADDATEMANVIIECLSKQTLRDRIGQQGANFVRNNYCWEALCRKVAVDLGIQLI